MENYLKKLTNPIATWGIGLIIGLLFGLIVLGWGIFPVKWVDAAPEQLLYDYQVDYLRTIIGTYGLDRDVGAAQARYFSLGDNAQTALAEIIQEPGSLPPELLMGFSQEVAGLPVEKLIALEAEAPESGGGLNVGVILLLALLFLGLGVGLTYIILRGRKPEAPYETLEVEPIPEAGAPEPELEAVEPETAAAAEWQAETWEEEPQAMPPSEAIEAEPEVGAPVAEEREMRLASREGLDLPPFLAAAAGAAPVEAEAEIAARAPEEPIETAGEEAGKTTEPQTDSPMGGELLEEAALAEEIMGELTGEGLLVEPEEPPIEKPAPEAEIAAPEAEVEQELTPEPTTESEVDAEAPVSKGLSPGVSPDDPIEVKMRLKLAYLEGIGMEYSQKLAEAGITTTGKLMVEAITRKGRQELAEKSGIPEALLLRWVNHIDLYRIKGIGSEYADLLEAAGVDSVPELAQRNPDHLHQTLVETNLEKRLARQEPSLEQVAGWIEQAKLLPRIVQY